MSQRFLRQVEIASVSIFLRDGRGYIFDRPPIQVDTDGGWLTIYHDDLRTTSFPSDFVAQVVTVRREKQPTQDAEGESP